MATLSVEDRATATGNMQKLLEFGRTVFELCEWTDRQTDKPTYSLQYFATVLGEVNIHIGLQTDAHVFQSINLKYELASVFPLIRCYTNTSFKGQMKKQSAGEKATEALYILRWLSVVETKRT